MNMIIEASGLSRKTVYARYPNKTALIDSVVRNIVARGLQPVEIRMSSDWKQDLRCFVHTMLEEVCRPETMMLRRFILIEPATLEGNRPSIQRVITHRYVNPLIRFFESLADRGELPLQNFAFAAQALAELILLESQRRSLESEPADDLHFDRLTEDLTRLICHGICAPTAS
jgi:hypothetical protein